jgi:hypothetical protein
MSKGLLKKVFLKYNKLMAKMPKNRNTRYKQTEQTVIVAWYRNTNSHKCTIQE